MQAKGIEYADELRYSASASRSMNQASKEVRWRAERRVTLGTCRHSRVWLTDLPPGVYAGLFCARAASWVACSP